MKTKLKDNKIYRAIIIPICLILSFCGQFIPPINGLSSEAIGVILILVSSLILWLTIGIDWPSLLCLFALGFINSIGFNKVISSSFGNTTFAFLLFTFICTYALSKTTLLKRVALFFTNLKISRKNGYLFIFSFLFSVLLVGLFTSPSVLFIVMLPILNEILEILNISKKDKIAKVMMLGLGFSVSISSGMTPIAHVFPLLAMNAANIEVSAFNYMGMAIPTGLILFILMFFVLILFIRPDVKNIDFNKVGTLKSELGKLNIKDITILIISLLVLILWIVPSLFEYIYQPVYEYFNYLTMVMPPLLGAILLSIIHIDNEPLIKLDDAFKNGVPWGSLIMCAATLALGAALQNEDIGLITFLKVNLGEYLINLSPYLLLFIFILWAIIQTNLSSNMVTATLVAGVASTILLSSFTSLNYEATICIIGMLSSFAFATPPSMPHIALVASSESATSKDVLLYGSITALISVILALFIAYPLGTLIF